MTAGKVGAEVGVRLSEAAQIDDAPDPLPLGRRQEVPGRARVPCGEVAAAAHRVDQIEGDRYASQGVVEATVGEDVRTTHLQAGLPEPRVDLPSAGHARHPVPSRQ